MTKEKMFNYVLVHVARTWERIRVQQPFQEMPLDNIASADEIVIIAEEIMDDEVIVTFLEEYDIIDEKYEDFWGEKTGTMSDWYIEELADKIIKRDYLPNPVSQIRIKREDFINWYFNGGSDQDNEIMQRGLGVVVVKKLMNGDVTITPQDILNECNSESIPLSIVEGFRESDGDVGDAIENNKISDKFKIKLT